MLIAHATLLSFFPTQPIEQLLPFRVNPGQSYFSALRRNFSRVMLQGRAYRLCARSPPMLRGHYPHKNSIRTAFDDPRHSTHVVPTMQRPSAEPESRSPHIVLPIRMKKYVRFTRDFEEPFVIEFPGNRCAREYQDPQRVFESTRAIHVRPRIVRVIEEFSGLLQQPPGPPCLDYRHPVERSHPDRLRMSAVTLRRNLLQNHGFSITITLNHAGKTLCRNFEGETRR